MALSAVVKRILAHKYLIHIGYWLFIVLFFGFFWGSIWGKYDVTFITELTLLPAKMAVTYIYVYLTIPFLLLKRKYALFILVSLVNLLLFALVERVLIYTFLIPLNAVYDPKLPLFDIYQIMHLVLDVNTVTVLPIGAKLAQVWYKNFSEAKELERAKLEAELNYLKNQVQPHFLFNTLNNLYALIVAKSDKAETLLLKLSDLLRYMLYQTNVDRALLSAEIEHVKDYIEIEQLRYGDKVDVCFNVYGNVGTKDIAPLLLLPFVENCFKHGVAKSKDEAWIRIDVSVSDTFIEFIVENSVPILANGSEAVDTQSGIGLQNVRRRLDIIYKDCYELKTHLGEGIYLVKLKINI